MDCSINCLPSGPLSLHNIIKLCDVCMKYFYLYVYMKIWLCTYHCHIVCLSSSACRPGFYKAYAGNIKCSKCPPHSFSYGEASAICRCEKGFFRAEKDPPTMACTREYTRKKRGFKHDRHSVCFDNQINTFRL